jgi:hypothetical protein
MIKKILITVFDGIALLILITVFGGITLLILLPLWALLTGIGFVLEKVPELIEGWKTTCSRDPAPDSANLAGDQKKKEMEF